MRRGGDEEVAFYFSEAAVAANLAPIHSHISCSLLSDLIQ